MLQARRQLRVAPAGGVIGFDLPAVLDLGRAMGIDPFLMAEFLPDIEAAAVAAINDNLKENDG